MHLRVSDEAEMIGVDLDQFFDEQIGDWSPFGSYWRDAPGRHGGHCLLDFCLRGGEARFKGMKRWVDGSMYL